MRWHAQVVHVVRKDLHFTRWLLLAYAVVVAGATAAVAWEALGALSPPLLSVPLVLLGMTVLAVLVQADSPARSNAFWATLPLRPSAVFAAKVAGAALCLLVLPLLGQLAGLARHAVPGGELPALLGASALTYADWLAMAAVVAALTPNLRTFAVAFLLVAFCWLWAAQVIWYYLAPPSPAGAAPRHLWAVVSLGGALLVLAHQYLTRDTRRGVWLAGLLWVALLVLPALVHRSAPAAAPAPAAGPLPARLRPAALGLEGIGFNNGGADLRLWLEGASPSHQYVLVSPVAHLRLPDGSATRVAIDERRIWLTRLSVRPVEGLRWPGERRNSGRHGFGVRIDLTPAQRQALARGGARLTLAGHLEVRESRVRVELPLVEGAAAASAGRRVRVLGVEQRGDGPWVRVRVSAVASPHTSDGISEVMDRERLDGYALVNRGRGEAFVVKAWQSSGSGPGLVLPGPRASTSTIRLVQDRMVSEAAIPQGWLDGARLVLVDWVPLGSTPVVLHSAALRAEP